VRSQLTPGTVHVWRALIPAELTPEIEAALGAGEREYMARMTSDIARRQFGAAQAALRSVLVRYLPGVEPNAVGFRRGEHGKPFLNGKYAGSLQFNLTHSHDCVLAAVAPDREIGIDLEKVRERPAAERLAARFYADQEQRALREAPPAERERVFFRLWTRKEAHLKATGTGLSVSLRAIDTLNPGDGSWWYHELAPLPDYVACLAGEGPRPRVSYFDLAP
jgi:4'-phosphopantetheinyl transferase